MCDGNKDSSDLPHRLPPKVAVVGECTTDKPLLTKQPACAEFLTKSCTELRRRKLAACPHWLCASHLQGKHLEIEVEYLGR